MDPVVLSKPGNVRLEVLPPLALYVHIPWCVRKCPYCDFNSHERGGELPEREYVGKLIMTLRIFFCRVGKTHRQRVHRRWHAEPLFARRHRRAALGDPRSVQVEAGAEITLEANPARSKRRASPASGRRA